MAYDNTIPATGHSGSQDYNAIRGNFQQIQTSFSVNHEPLASGGGTEGYHTQIQLAAPVPDPNKVGTIGSIYTKGSPPELFFQNASTIFQLSGSILIESGNDGQGGTYQVFQTPWALKIFTGTTKTFNGSLNCTLSGAQLFGGTIYTGLCTCFGGGPAPLSFSPIAGANTFNIQINTANPGKPIRWFVLTD